MLITLMESYIRTEVLKLKEDDNINKLITNVKLRNNTPTQTLQKNNTNQSPATPMFNDDMGEVSRWEDSFKDGFKECYQSPSNHQKLSWLKTFKF
jgi:hypothetical protein